MEAYLEDNRLTLDEICEEYDECTEECPAYRFCLQLLKDAIDAYENGEILEAKDMTIEFINNITDFEIESEIKRKKHNDKK